METPSHNNNNTPQAVKVYIFSFFVSKQLVCDMGLLS